ncbi:MAG: phosphomannomutase/phosphoglucomutase [Bacteroidales bacterium]|jgi:phosphomannomutase|nr:phosphomannomutase/phosphoglucomutase [Bacteroidales bacterium]
MGAFKAYDIRGKYGTDFKKEDVYKIGFFLPELLNTKKILVGRDMRLSSPEIFAYLCKGIEDSGADVYNIGLSTTPMVYWATAEYGFDASVMITASHNPKNDNGLKISKTGALPVGYDTGLSTLERWVKERVLTLPDVKGKTIDFPKQDEYLKYQKSWLENIDNLKVTIDCSNGMASLFTRDLYGVGVDYMYDILDGTFPNHEANPLDMKNIVDIQKRVRKNHSDIGVIFDGDADRVMFIDEKSNFISPDLMIAVLGHYFLEEKGLRGKVLQDIRTSKSVKTYIENLGGTMEMWRVGRAYAALKLREIDGVFGGELAGHYYFRDFNYSDSGILACTLLLRIFSKMKEKGISVSEVIAGIVKYANSGEINFKLERKNEAMEALRTYFTESESVVAFYDFDGYRIEFEKWWFNVRPSNTEPYLRLIVEAENAELLQEKIGKASEIINSL